MDARLVRRLVDEKLRDRTTYVVAAVVGTLINAYGQLLVPWFRSFSNPFESFWRELQTRPGLTLFSVFLAYAFPFCVGVYSGVAARYKNRRVESIADFPDRKPDPVFRAARSGRVVEVGANTRRLFERYRIESAQQILGVEVWDRIVSLEPLPPGTKVLFEPEGTEYLVAHALTADGEFNVYLSRLSR